MKFSLATRNIAVIGSGAGGIQSAIRLAEEGFFVDLFEKESTLLPICQTSYQTPGRAGQGFHYIDAETGIYYLKATMDVFKAFPTCTRGFSKPDHHYMRHGLYMVMKERSELSADKAKFASLFPKDDILATYEQLRMAYMELVKADPGNKLFGETSSFFTVQDPKKYSHIIDHNLVKCVVDSREELVNWPQIRQKLLEKVEILPNIRVRTYRKVAGVFDNPKGMGWGS